MRQQPPGQFGLFGGVERPRVDRAALYGNPRPRGYAAPPGTGPEGETCGSCANCRANRFKNTYYKCGLMVRTWTATRISDVTLRSPACSKWEAGEPRETHIHVDAKEQ